MCQGSGLRGDGPGFGGGHFGLGTKDGRFPSGVGGLRGGAGVGELGEDRGGRLSQRAGGSLPGRCEEVPARARLAVGLCGNRLVGG